MMFKIKKRLLRISSRLILLILAGAISTGCTALNAVGTQRGRDPLSDEQVDKRIREYRTAEVTLTVTDSRGNRLANSVVKVSQVSHKFLFGCNGFEIDPNSETEYNRRFAEIFNYVTLPFYWGQYEKNEGETSYQRVAAMAGWCRKNNIIIKGHPLCWHEGEPEWLKNKMLEEVRLLQMARIEREVKSFAGDVEVWDVVNEAVIMPTYPYGPNTISKLCSKIGQVALVNQAFGTARRANPKAKLILNDFDTWSGKYEKLIGRCFDAGVCIDAIGIQSHMHHGYWGKEKPWNVCQKFAKFGKLIDFTEVTILSGKLKEDSDWKTVRKDWVSTDEGEERQGREALELYRVLFSHPAVEAITWWDFSDCNSWMGAPSGVLRKDMSPKPAYDVLKKLIKKDWWTGLLELKTNEEGRVSFRGFLGDYIIECEKGNGRFTIDKPGGVRKTVGVN